MGCDLELEIASAGSPRAYAVTVDSPSGAAAGTVRLDVEGLLGRRRELAASVLASAVTTRAGLSTLERPVREVGQALFESVFADRVYGRYTASVQEAARRGEPLRVVLRLRASELAGLPWETLFDPEAGEYLCQREPVVRYVESAQSTTPLPIDPPLRILGLVAAPKDLPQLSVEEERRRLSEALAELAGRRQVELVWAPGGSWPVLQEHLVAGPWHVLHFVGHGGTDPAAGGGMLALENEGGRAAMVSATRFARLLHSCRPVPRLVVLNSCQSGEAAANDLLSSTAAALVNSGVTAAVAMQFAVTDPAALAFARGFYQALSLNRPVDEAVRLGRIAIDGTAEETLEWVTPVLYLRTDDTRLFRVNRQPIAQESEGPSPDLDEESPQEARLYRLYVQALAALRTGDHHHAIAVLDSLLTLDPGYRDAAARRDAARRVQKLATVYQLGQAAEEAGDWAIAGQHYAEVAAIDSGYQDAARRRDACCKRLEIACLQDELRLHAETGNWLAVLAVNDQLTALDPSAADPDMLASNASKQLHRQQQTKPAETGGHQGPDGDQGPDRHQRMIRVRSLTGHTDWVKAVAVTPDGRHVVSGGDDKTLLVWDLGTGRPVRTLIGHTSPVKAVAVTPDGRHVVSGGDDKTLLVWNLGTGGPVRSLSSHTNWVLAAAVTPDGRHVVSGAGDNTVRVWDLSSGQLIRTLTGHTNWVWAVAVTPDGRHVVSGAGDNTVRVWDLSSGQLIRTLTGHTNPVSSLAVMPDGRHVVSGAGDNTVRVWDLTTGQPIGTLTGHKGWLKAVAVTPDGRHIVSGAGDNTVRVWDLAGRWQLSATA